MSEVLNIARFNRLFVFSISIVSIAMLVVCLFSVESIMDYGGNRYDPATGITLFLIGFVTISVMAALSTWHSYNVIMNRFSIYIEDNVIHYYGIRREVVGMDQIVLIGAASPASPLGSKVDIYLKSGGKIQIHTAMMIEDGETISGRLRSAFGSYSLPGNC